VEGSVLGAEELYQDSKRYDRDGRPSPQLQIQNLTELVRQKKEKENKEGLLACVVRDYTT
jgi:hypothetical protein